MGKCYILGAGFSKAVSNLSVMKDLTKKFWDIQNKEKKIAHNNRVSWGDKIQDYLLFLENEFFVKPCIDIKNGETYRECDFQDNLEALISFIDLNTSGEIKARVTDKDGNTSNFSKSSLFWNFTDLSELRACIQTYIYLALIKPEIKKDVLKLFIKKLKERDVKIISFNYDLIIERALFDVGIWKPKDGYGIDFKDFPNITKSHDIESEIQIYKLHGSLNWGPDLKLRFYYDDNEPIFPDYLQSSSNAPPFQGKHLGLWMLPSFIKQFTVPELIRVWEKAFTVINDSDEIVIVGYSLPKEDSAACLLLGTTGISKKRLTIVDPNVDKLQDRYQKITSNKHIRKYCSIEDFVNTA